MSRLLSRRLRVVGSVLPKLKMKQSAMLRSRHFPITKILCHSLSQLNRYNTHLLLPPKHHSPKPNQSLGRSVTTSTTLSLPASLIKFASFTLTSHSNQRTSLRSRCITLPPQSFLATRCTTKLLCPRPRLRRRNPNLHLALSVIQIPSTTAASWTAPGPCGHALIS